MNAERILKLILRLNGAVMAMALFAVFLPHDTLAAIHQWLGLGKYPEGKIVDYLARSLSAFYAITGILYLILAHDIRAFAPIIAFLAWAGICFGSATVVMDLQLDFPAWWTWSEGPFIVVFSVAVLWLQWRIRQRDHDKS